MSARAPNMCPEPSDRAMVPLRSANTQHGAQPNRLDDSSDESYVRHVHGNGTTQESQHGWNRRMHHGENQPFPPRGHGAMQGQNQLPENRNTYFNFAGSSHATFNYINISSPIIFPSLNGRVCLWAIVMGVGMGVLAAVISNKDQNGRDVNPLASFTEMVIEVAWRKLKAFLNPWN
ncbi:hypothetical protein GGR55DRAFT_684017 [Xylaria sp. FL0064]|nr:hypothetical protein GGR55DRAFT_684017 [Xylaria sp. FL0064]